MCLLKVINKNSSLDKNHKSLECTTKRYSSDGRQKIIELNELPQVQ